MAIPPQIGELIRESYRLERAGNMAQALCLGQQALKMAQAESQPEAEASALASMAMVHAHLGHYERGKALATQALDVAPPDVPAQVDAWLALAICSNETNDVEGSETYNRKAADLSRQLGYWEALYRALHNTAAGIYYTRGQFERAFALEEEAIRIAEANGLTALSHSSYTILGLISLYTGRFDRTRAALDSLRSILTPGSLHEGYYFLISGHLALLENPHDAPNHYTHALTRGETVGEPGLNIEARLGMSRYYRTWGSLGTAAVWADEAYQWANEAGYQHLAGVALIERARIAWEQGNLEAGLKEADQAVLTLTAVGAVYDLVRAQLLRSAILHRMKSRATADAWLEAFELIRQNGYNYLLEQEWDLILPVADALGKQSSTSHSESSVRLEEALQYLEGLPPPPMDVRLLGDFSVRKGQRVFSNSDWHRPLVRRLFIYFVLQRREPLQRDRILEDLWPDSDPHSAGVSFRTVISRLRHILDPHVRAKAPCRYLTSEEDVYWFDPCDRVRVDLEVFLAKVKPVLALSRQEKLTNLPTDYLEALEHWGPLLPHLAYEDWIVLPREACLSAYTDGCLLAAQVFLETGRPLDASHWAERAIRVAPWLEEGYQLLLLAYARAGQRSRALRVYDEASAALLKELDVLPSAYTTSLAERLRAGEEI